MESEAATIGYFFESQRLGLYRVAVGNVWQRIVGDGYNIPELEIHMHPEALWAELGQDWK